MIKHSSPISGIAAFQDKFVATAGYDNKVVLWDASRQTAISRGVHDHLANQCEFSPDGKWLASSSSDYTARIWSVPSMRLHAVLGGHQDDVEGITFHPTRPWVATSSRDGCVRVFNLQGQLLHCMQGHSADVIAVGWIGDSGELISSSDDGTVRRWDVETGREMLKIDFDGVETDTVAISNDGLIFAGNDAGEIILIDGDRKATYNAHNAGIKRLIYDRQSSELVSLSYDRTVKFWETSAVPNLRLRHSSHLPSIVWPRSCAVLNSDEVVFVTFGGKYASYNRRTDTWDLSNIGHTNGINAACLLDDRLCTIGDAGILKIDGTVVAEMGSLCNFLVVLENRLLTGGQMGQVFDAETGEVYHQHRSPLNCAVSFPIPGGGAAIIGTYTGEGLLFESQAQERPRFVGEIQLANNAIKGVSYAKGILFSVCATGAAAFHDVVDWHRVHGVSTAHDKIANGCAALPSGIFVSVSRDLKLRFWKSGRSEIIETPHSNSIKSCAVSRNGSYVATADYAGHLGVFDIDEGRYVAFERLTDAGLSSVIANRSNDGFIATSYDGQVYPFELSHSFLAAAE